MLSTRRRRLLVAGGAALAGYGAYRLYRSEAVEEGRAWVARLRLLLAKYTDALGAGAEATEQLVHDLRQFLLTDADELPPSLRQLAKLLSSREASDTAASTVSAVVRGVSAGKGSGAPQPSGANNGGGASAPPQPGGLERVLEALLSERGQSLVSVAVAMGARNLVAGYCEAQERAAPAAGARSAADTALDVLASPQGQRLAVLAAAGFASAGVRAYLDQTLEVNFYEDMLSSISRPEHLEAVKQVVGVFARDVVGAYLAGSPQQAPPPPAAAAQRQRGAASLPPQRLLSSFRQLGSQEGLGEEGALSTGDSPRSVEGGQAPQPLWHMQQQQQPRLDDLDSDGLLHAGSSGAGTSAAAAAKGFADGSGGLEHRASGDSASLSVRTPLAADSPSKQQQQGLGAPLVQRAAPQQQQLQQQQPQQQSAVGGLVAAVGREWLNVAADPNGRRVLVELAGTAAKEAARGASSALAERFQAEWFVVAAVAALLLAWFLQRLLSMLGGLLLG